MRLNQFLLYFNSSCHLKFHHSDIFYKRLYTINERVKQERNNEGRNLIKYKEY